MNVANIGSSAAYPLKQTAHPSKPGIDRTSELYKACEDFEAIFIKQMLDAMRKTIDRSDSLLGGGMGQDMYEDMLYDQYAKKMASTGQFGLAETIYKQVSSKL
ncbi:MAG TPA: rod-binding protein [Spirochaetia bacterium]